MGIIGELLYDELNKTGIEVFGIIDKKAKRMADNYPYPLVSPEDKLLNADCVIVTALYYYDAIKKDMINRTSIPIISLEDILFDGIRTD